MVDIYLGLVGAENLLSEENRDFSVEAREAGKERVEVESGRVYYYITTGFKYTIEFEYERILDTDLAVIKTEYLRQQNLSLKIGKGTTPETYDIYTVYFKGTLEWEHWKTLSIVNVVHRIYEGVKFTLEEVS